MALTHVCFPVLTDELFRNNSAELDGGAVFLESVNSIMQCERTQQSVAYKTNMFYDTTLSLRTNAINSL